MSKKMHICSLNPFRLLQRFVILKDAFLLISGTLMTLSIEFGYQILSRKQITL